MKRMKKMVSIALTLVMAFAMALTMKVTTFAAGKTFTITAPNNNHTYEIYQIFTGDLSEGGKTLSNVKWGSNGTKTPGTDVDKTVLEEIKGLNSGDADQTKLATIKKYVDLTGNPYKTVKNGTVDVPEGYYLIKDKDNSLTNQNDVYTTYIVQVSKDLTITPKADKPQSEKKVKDTNDTTGDTTGWQDSADYDIGDNVPFQLTGTVTSKYADYKAYKFVFHDKESAGLTFNADSVKVYVDGKQISSGYEVTTSPEDGHTFDVVFKDLKQISEVKAGSKITVEYTSKLNDKAVIGSAGNPNTMHLEYSNNPNDDQGGETGKTPEDTVIVFTYKTIINKVDASGAALKGAEFKLYKVMKDGSEKEVAVVKNPEGTTFTFNGLDDGDYILRETTTPDGYNSISDIKFRITASHDVLSESPALKDLTGDKVTGEIELTADKTAGSLTSNIVNQKGSELPETGGMGTTAMYLVGGVLVAGALLLLITKRRMDTDR
ncbi:MAG: isopeptide-forming domain-containing fimbrial protein [Anaerostipes hadrus]